MSQRGLAVSLAHRLRGLAGFALAAVCLVMIPSVEAAITSGLMPQAASRWRRPSRPR
jgi:hypothetical protein